MLPRRRRRALRRALELNSTYIFGQTANCFPQTNAVTTTYPIVDRCELDKARESWEVARGGLTASRGVLQGVSAFADPGGNSERFLITTLEKSILVSDLQWAQNGNPKPKLPTFVSEVQAQSGKAISSAYAALLVAWTNDLLSTLSAPVTAGNG